MSWEDQGRQYHMWFGHGTAQVNSKPAAPDPSVTALSPADRASALAYGVVGSLPPGQRKLIEGQYHTGTLPKLKEALTAWMRATQLGLAAFAPWFLGRSADDPVATKLYEAAVGARYATRQDDLSKVAGKIAEAIMAVGISQWPRFVGDAVERARDPATVAAIEKSRQLPDLRRDAIKPVYPVETAIGVAAAGIVGEPAAAARVAGDAILKQVLPDARPPPGDATISTAKPEVPAVNFAKQAESLDRALPAKPDDLLKQGWKEISHPEAEKLGHRKFKNPKTGEIVRFDQGRPGKPGFEGQDHYHHFNPNKTSTRDENLDANGNPVARGSRAPHILPRTP